MQMGTGGHGTKKGDHRTCDSRDHPASHPDEVDGLAVATASSREVQYKEDADARKEDRERSDEAGTRRQTHEEESLPRAARSGGDSATTQ